MGRKDIIKDVDHENYDYQDESMSHLIANLITREIVDDIMFQLTLARVKHLVIPFASTSAVSVTLKHAES